MVFSFSFSLYGDYPEVIVKTARELGENLGLCFQLYDDILDFSDDSSKDKFLDIKNGQLTFITYKYLVETNSLKSYEQGLSLESLLDIKELTPVIAEVKLVADEYHNKCLKKLDELVSLLEILKRIKTYKAFYIYLEN